MPEITNMLPYKGYRHASRVNLLVAVCSGRLQRRKADRWRPCLHRKQRASSRPRSLRHTSCKANVAPVRCHYLCLRWALPSGFSKRLAEQALLSRQCCRRQKLAACLQADLFLVRSALLGQ